MVRSYVYNRLCIQYKALYVQKTVIISKQIMAVTFEKIGVNFVKFICVYSIRFYVFDNIFQCRH